MIARDLFQNYFDANKNQLDQIRTTVDGNRVTIHGPAETNLRRLFYLGSEKGDEDVGQYGEGFKAAATCLLRNHGIEPIVVSGKRATVIRVSPDKVEGTELRPVLYDFFELVSPVDGTFLILQGCSQKLITALEFGLRHFFYESNPLLGTLLWSTRNGFSCYESSKTDGYIFYKRLRRGVLRDLPIILVIEKEYSKLEKLVGQDRDRKVFGENVLKTFYKVFANGCSGYYRHSQAIIVEHAKAFWERGHPLLAELADKNGWFHKWDPEILQRVFGDGYFARAESDKNNVTHWEQIKQIEKDWLAEGKKRLPAYFAQFGLRTAQSFIEDAKKIDRDSKRRKPTENEKSCISFLGEVTKDIHPELMMVLERTGIKYSVAPSMLVLGEYKKERPWGSSEVFLEQSLFEDDFGIALSVFIHEHAHVVGRDGSRNFTDILTEFIGILVRAHKTIAGLEEHWKSLTDFIKEERARKDSNDRGSDINDIIYSLDIDTAKEIIKKMPVALVRSVIATR